MQASRHRRQRLQEAGALVLPDGTDADVFALSEDDHPGEVRRHVLEGGNTLAMPMPGTMGYNRLFCAEHPPYVPRTKRCAELKEQIATERAARAAGSTSST